MRQVTKLGFEEHARLDAGTLEKLIAELGEEAAEDVVCRAMEELAIKLAQSERLLREGDIEAMRKPLRTLGAISLQLGMGVLARISEDVLACIERCDSVALAAVHQRLLRAGEACLTEIWELQYISI